MQTQTQTQTLKFKFGQNSPIHEQEKIDEAVNAIFEMFTWGRCRGGMLDIVYPEKVSLEPLTRGDGEHVVEVPRLAKIKYVNRDSRKNINREIEFVDIYQTLVVRYHGSWSCSHSFDMVFYVEKRGDSIVFKKLPVEEEIVEREAGKFKHIIKRHYVAFNGVKIVLGEVKLREEIAREKLILKLIVDREKVCVNGDTYHVKEELKKMGMRWNPEKKYWCTAMEADAVREELKKLGVQVEG